MLTHNSNINVTISGILEYKKVSTMLKSQDWFITDALGNFVGAPNLQSSNSCKNRLFSSLNLKHCTLVNHDKVNNTSNF